MARLVGKGRIALANDSITAGLVTEDTETRQAILDEVSPLVGEALADPTTSGIVTTAAGIAVTNKLATEDVLVGSDPRSPKIGKPTLFRVKTPAGAIPFQVDERDTHIGDSILRPSKGWGVFGPNREIYAKLDMATAEIYIPRIRTDRLVVGSGGGGAGVSKVHAIPAGGQSNMAGQNMTTAQADPADSRIFQYGVHTGTITTASVPLDNQDTTQIGLSPATVFAREYVKTLPADEVVLIIPASRSGSGLVTDVAAGKWAIDYAGSNPKLYTLMWAQIQAALTAATTKWGVTPTVDAFLWLQGEADSGVAQATYSAAFDALVNDLRGAGKLNQPNLRVILGGMVPERTAAIAGAPAIRLAHVDTPRRLEYTAYVDGIPNTANYPSTDGVHYSREGTIRIGKGMFHAWADIAPFNAAANIPLPPGTVTATRSNGTITATWSFPYTRATSFVAEYSTDNGANWTAFPARATPLERTAVVTGITAAAVLVRVATVNEKAIADGNPSSHYTTPATVIGV